jgi:hypothetical protein
MLHQAPSSIVKQFLETIDFSTEFFIGVSEINLYTCQMGCEL